MAPLIGLQDQTALLNLCNGDRARTLPRSKPSSSNISKLKCVLVGDGAVGKSSLIVSYTTNGYPMEYVPTAFDNFSVLVTVDNQPVQLQLCDTAGQDDFNSLRLLCYPQTDVFVLCFSVVCPTSFHNVEKKWLPEIRAHCQNAPIILVGCQSDLRSDVKTIITLASYHQQPIGEQQGRHLAHKINATLYVECSALTQKNLKEVFDKAIIAALERQNSSLIQMNKMKSKTLPLLGRTFNKSSVPACQQIHPRKKSNWKKLCCFY